MVAIFIYDHNFTIFWDIMTKLWRICDNFIVNLCFYENRAPDCYEVKFQHTKVIQCLKRKAKQSCKKRVKAEASIPIKWIWK